MESGSVNMKGHTMAVIQGNGVISRNGLLAAAAVVVAVLDSPSKGFVPALIGGKQKRIVAVEEGSSEDSGRNDTNRTHAV
jgi:hypothetical protein